MQTRDQEYAALIFEQVKSVAIGDQKKYGAMAHQLPILVRTAGLAQALVYADSRSKDAVDLLLTHLAVAMKMGDKNNLLVSSRSVDITEYIRLTNGVLKALLWYKRFAQSVLHIDASEADDETVAS